MKNKFYLLIFVFISFSLKAQDYNSSQLTPVYGISNFHGESDSKANVTINSDNNSINIKISIIDDSLVLKENWKESDHVEIWFNMDPKPNDYFVHNKEFYIGKSIEANQRENFRSFLKSKTSDATKQKMIDTAELPIVKELNGMVHWAFDIKNETAYLYDTEYYLKLPIQNEVSDKIKIHKEVTPVGYNVSITLKPEALFFMRNKNNKDLTFMIDVFDTDKTSTDLTVLSTSARRKWGAPEVFTNIQLKKPLVIATKTSSRTVKNSSPSFYMYKNKKWHNYYLKTNKVGKDDYYTYDYIEF